MDLGEQTYLILLDFSKAFDKVPHERLLYNAHYYGVRGTTLQSVRDFLSDRNQSLSFLWRFCVVAMSFGFFCGRRGFCHRTESDIFLFLIVDGKSSTNAPFQSGVTQFSVLGPLMFLLFINDLPEYVHYSSVRLFADDCVPYRKIQSNSDIIKLQEDLDSLLQ